MAPERRRTNERKTLRQSLRDLLRCRRRRSQVEQPRVIGSGILRKADHTTSLLPLISSISLFPDFGSSTYDVDRFSISTPTPFQRRPTGDILIVSDYSVNNSTASLLPSTRLSQFNLHQTFIDKAASPQKVQYSNVPDILVQGASRQASFESYQTSARHSSSSLKLRRSSPSLASSITGATSVGSPEVSPSLSRRSHTRSGLGEGNRHLPRPPKPPLAGSKSTPGQRVQQDMFGISSSIKHFTSFCVLDTLAPGCPVTATSEDLRYIFDVGEEFFLHNQECDGTSIDIVTGYDAAGKEITHLVLFSPLVSPSSGRSRFMLAALVDVTDFLQDTATLPELETISEAPAEDEDTPTPRSSRRPTPHPPWKSRTHELSAEDLLGGCFIGDGVEDVESLHSYNPPRSEDIWLKLATEEKKKSSSSRGSRSSPGSPASLDSTPTNTTSSSTVDSVLDDFMAGLQQLYSQFFLLAKSPLDDRFYEICNVSPSVSASKDYVQGHLSQTAAPDIATLSQKLGGEGAFSMQVRWGSRGQARQLYCIPLFGQSSITWICVLVQLNVPFLW